MPRRVSWETSFEMDFPRIVPGGTGVPILCPSPRVEGCYIHLLSGTISINDMVWAREGQCLDRAWIDRCSGRYDEKRDTWARSRRPDRAS